MLSPFYLLLYYNIVVTKKFCSFKKQGAKRSIFPAILLQSKPIKSKCFVWYGLTARQKQERWRFARSIVIEISKSFLSCWKQAIKSFWNVKSCKVSRSAWLFGGLIRSGWKPEKRTIEIRKKSGAKKLSS